MKVNIIFPMAGESSRFNYIFKPFIQISDQKFIELAFKYFYKYEDYLNKIYFVVTEEQNKTNQVNEKLNEIFTSYSIDFEIIVLEKKTKSQYETVRKGILKCNITGPTIICDCDHSIDVSPLFDYLLEKNNFDITDILLSSYKIGNEDISSWGIFYIDKENNIINFSEKILLNNIDFDKYYGLIGCNYIKSTEEIKKYKNFTCLTEYYKYSLDINNSITYVKINNALFFGTKTVLNNINLQKKKEKTLFCDLDGTLIKHQATPNYENEILFENSLKSLVEFKNENINNKIIITTARTKKNKIIKLLKDLNIPFDDVLCGLNSGPRILINDVKTNQNFILMANSINVYRDTGIDFINYENIKNDCQIIKTLKGGSFSKTFLIRENNKHFVRKIIYKNSENDKHYCKLKLQRYNLMRFNEYFDNICPSVSNEKDNDYFYYYDMEYLNNFITLYEVENKNIYISKLSKFLNEEIYIMKKKNKNIKWIKEFLNKKINFQQYENLSEKIKKIINLEYIIINDKKYIGLKKIYNKINDKDIDYYNPKFLAPIHGDLTYENIMINNDNIKLIDLDGAQFIDAIELDLGKLFQSFLSRYEDWSTDEPIIKVDLNNNILLTKNYYQDIDLDIFKYWKEILNIDNNIDILKKGIFYMIIHMYRMIPFKFNVNENSAIYVLKEIIYWSNYIYNL